MTEPMRGAFDCDVHATPPDLKALLPYLDPYWQEQIVLRGIHPLDIASYPPKNPLTGRADWRPPEGGRAGTKLEDLRRFALDRLDGGLAICNVVYGAQTVFNADFGAALCRAVNDWVVDEWLNKEPRLRASIVVPLQDPDQAVDEIERRAGDKRFVQVLMTSTGDMPLGRRYYWPIYRAAEKHGLPVGFHAAHSNRFATTYVGWPSYFIEDYNAHAQSFQGLFLSLVYEGVFIKFPNLKVVFIESGVTWLPACMMRADASWRALRFEVPWLERAPSEIAREHFRLTTQPFDAPASQQVVEAFMDQLGSDEMLLFSSDYPHWQYDGDDPRPQGMSQSLLSKIMIDNPRRTYPRLMETVA